VSFYTNVQHYKDNILLRGVRDGKRFSERVKYSPTLFVDSQNESEYKTLDGKRVSPILQSGIKDARKTLKQYSGVSNFPVYGNTNFHYCYISDEYSDKIDYDPNQIVVANIDIEVGSESGFPYPESAVEPIIAISMKIGDKMWALGCEDFDSPSHVEYVKCDDEEHLLLEFLDIWSRDYPDIVTGWNVEFFDIPYLMNRIEKKLGKLKHEFTPGEDEYTAAKKLSPWKIVYTRSVPTIGGKEQQAGFLSGISVLDYLKMYRKFTYTNQESYRLDYIASVEIGEKKLSYDEYDSLHQLYKQNFQKFIEYNIRDVELVDRIDAKMKLIDMVFALAYTAKVNYSDVFSQVRMWDTMIFNHLRKKNIVIPLKSKEDKNARYVGAYVKDPIVGMHDWIVSFDLNSLYPHLIMQYNISPETLVPREDAPNEVVQSCDLGGRKTISSIRHIIEKEFDTSALQDNDLTVTPNFQFFSREIRGFLPEMMDDLYSKRVESKQKMIEAQQKLQHAHASEKYDIEKDISRYKNDQLARKVQLNSAYGALGNQYFRYYDIRLAEAVTKSGQLSIRWIETKVNEYLNELLNTSDVDYIVASDTDSIYITLAGLVDRVFPEGASTEKIVKFLDKVSSEKFEPFIDKCYDELAEYLNAYDQKMSMKREVIANKGLWTSKKRYILNVFDNEGVRYSEPKLKIMGIEAVKSSTPEVCRDKIREALAMMMTGTEDDIIKFIETFREEFKALPAGDVAFPRGVNGIQKYRTHSNSRSLDDSVVVDPVYAKGTPVHVKGAILYNHMVRECKLSRRYELIHDGDKIKFVYLKEPNPTKDSVIAIVNNLPVEFGLDSYIDYDKQFEKAFVYPLEIILDKIGWRAKNVSTLDQFFV
jgi:DNA polymerase elongation subunit (family B)